MGSKQRLQAMSDTVLEAIQDWLSEHPAATPEERIRLDLGYLTHEVLLQDSVEIGLTYLISFIMFTSVLFFQTLLKVLHDLLQAANPEYDPQGFAKGIRLASDSALLLSTTKMLDDLLGNNHFTFPVGMQKQPPAYDEIPPSESLPASKGKKRSKAPSAVRASPEVKSFLVVVVKSVVLDPDSLRGQGVGKIGGDQDVHLDGLTEAIFSVTNLTRGKGYFGAILGSAGYIHPLKKLSREEFAPFRREFKEYRCPGDLQGRKLIDVMPGTDTRLKLRAAWRIYAFRKLSQLGIVGGPWKRAYIEMAEGVMAICSMSLLHFGSRFPLYFDNRPVPDDLWHLRLHMYIGSKVRPHLEGDENSAMLDQVQDATVDIYEHREDSDWISAAQHYYGLRGIAY